MKTDNLTSINEMFFNEDLVMFEKDKVIEVFFIKRNNTTTSFTVGLGQNMSRDKGGEAVSAIISLVNNQYIFLVELLRALTVMFKRKRLVRKRLLLLMSSDSKMQNGKKGSRCSPHRFYVRLHHNLK